MKKNDQDFVRDGAVQKASTGKVTKYSERVTRSSNGLQVSLPDFDIFIFYKSYIRSQV